MDAGHVALAVALVVALVFRLRRRRITRVTFTLDREHDDTAERPAPKDPA